MNKSTALSLLAALLTLASCQVTTLGPPPATGDRQVDVGVGRSFLSGERRIEVDDEVAEVGPGNSAVIWLLRSSASGYQFSPNGIRFDYPPTKPTPAHCASTPDPRESFVLDKCGPEAGGRIFKCPRRERQQPGACFAYTVTLVPRPGSDPVPPLDPWIKNQ